jgi:hypothetical protein
MIATKKTFCALALFALTIPAFSQAPAAGAKACPPYPDPKMKVDASPLVAAIDLNKDGKLTLDEYKAVGAPENSFKFFTSKSHLDYVTPDQLLKEPPPDGMDTACDGKITLEKLRAFAAKQSAGGGAPGAPPSGSGAPPSGAPPAAPETK